MSTDDAAKTAAKKGKTIINIIKRDIKDTVQEEPKFAPEAQETELVD